LSDNPDNLNGDSLSELFEHEKDHLDITHLGWFEYGLRWKSIL